MRNFQELAQAILQGESFSSFNKDEQSAYLAGLGVSHAKTTKEGQTTIGKVVIYPSEKGGIHFQGVPGTSAKWGMTLYMSTFEWIIENSDAIMSFILDNQDKLSTKKPN